MAIVDVNAVSKKYRLGEITVNALKEISLMIDPGEFVALAGPSGSGKTTLLNLVGGLDHPDSGAVTVDGNDLASLGKGTLADLRLKRIGFVFQAYNLIPVLTAAENVAYILRLQKVGKPERQQRVQAILDEVGLEGLYDRRPAELSGGQQQRVAVARAIVSAPAIILADEPTANLDSKTGERLLKLMARLNQDKGTTFIFATHDEMVMAYARRIIYLRDGRIVSDQRK